MNYEAIQGYIVKARIERSVALGELIAEAIVKAWQSAARAANGLASMIEGTSNYLPRSQA
jgi:hypothetical protein